MNAIHPNVGLQTKSFTSRIRARDFHVTSSIEPSQSDIAVKSHFESDFNLANLHDDSGMKKKSAKACGQGKTDLQRGLLMGRPKYAETIDRSKTSVHLRGFGTPLLTKNWAMGVSFHGLLSVTRSSNASVIPVRSARTVSL